MCASVTERLPKRRASRFALPGWQAVRGVPPRRYGEEEHRQVVQCSALHMGAETLHHRDGRILANRPAFPSNST